MYQLGQILEIRFIIQSGFYIPPPFCLYIDPTILLIFYFIFSSFFFFGSVLPSSHYVHHVPPSPPSSPNTTHTHMRTRACAFISFLFPIHCSILSTYITCLPKPYIQYVNRGIWAIISECTIFSAGTYLLHVSTVLRQPIDYIISIALANRKPVRLGTLCYNFGFAHMGRVFKLELRWFRCVKNACSWFNNRHKAKTKQKCTNEI